MAKPIKLESGKGLSQAPKPMLVSFGHPTDLGWGGSHKLCRMPGGTWVWLQSMCSLNWKGNPSGCLQWLKRLGEGKWGKVSDTGPSIWLGTGAGEREYTVHLRKWQCPPGCVSEAGGGSVLRTYPGQGLCPLRLFSRGLPKAWHMIVTEYFLNKRWGQLLWSH